MEGITRKIIITTVVLVLSLGAVAAALSVYAHGEDEDAGTWAGRQAGYRGGMHGPMMGAMGAGYGRGYEGYEHCPGAEEMEEHMGPGGYWHDGMRNLTELSGSIVDVDVGTGIIRMTDGSGATYEVVVLPRYVDASNGYLVSGFWLVEKLAETLADGENPAITVETPAGPAYNGRAVAVSIHALGLDLVSQMYYMHP
ncbi:MAG: hypothetical protein F7C38_05205 [Desulfurococcales archaeon]|nr:hypothetical protein [Desulfurococcales archaeon]